MLPPDDEGPADEKRAMGSGFGGFYRRRLTGWRGGVLLNCVLSLLVLVAAVVCLVLAAARTRMLAGESAVFTGPCDRAAKVEWGVRAAANVVCVVLLAGANYVFQVLSAPTREEVGRAHERRRWLDIGIPSVRNLRSIGNGRAALAVGVLVAALVAQVM